MVTFAARTTRSERGVWELYLSEIDSPDGSMAPGVRFQSADYTWKDLHPWKRPQGNRGRASLTSGSAIPSGITSPGNTATRRTCTSCSWTAN